MRLDVFDPDAPTVCISGELAEGEAKSHRVRA
jgi:hypothetical protein